MALKAFCDRCNEDIPHDTKHALWLQFCDIDECWNAAGDVEQVAMLCGGCVKLIRQACER